MNVFVLNAGRSGSTTFYKACQHITNYTSGHETNAGKLGDERVSYSDNHIEIDNRLSWFLGRLDKKYGNDAFYVYLKRRREDVVNSYLKRYNRGIIHAYKEILFDLSPKTNPIAVCEDYCRTVEENIALFLQDKANVICIYLNEPINFPYFLEKIGAQGNLEKAMQEFNVKHNAHKPVEFKYKLSKKLATAYNDYHWGQQVAGKFQWTFGVIIMLKLFDAPAWFYFASVATVVPVVWFIGHVMNKTNFRLKIQRANFKGLLS